MRIIKSIARKNKPIYATDNYLKLVICTYVVLLHVQMSIFCCLTAFGLIAGGIANIVFFIDNNEIYSDLDCRSSEGSGGICSDLFSINACEITCGVS